MSHLSNAAEAMAAVVRTITPDRLANRTPCAEYDVRALVGHLLQWGPPLEGAGRKENVPPLSDVDLANWREDLLAQLDRTTEAWAPAAAWEGVTVMGGPMEMSAAVIGGMIAGELAVHGWDLAVATGQKLSLPDDTLAYLLAEVAASAEQGRQMGLFGPEVPVPADAPVLDRVLGLTGRDPAWE
jgi:uncharacterized protein (TIGR03086 family)